jgi:hypothetical protein
VVVPSLDTRLEVHTVLSHSIQHQLGLSSYTDVPYFNTISTFGWTNLAHEPITMRSGDSGFIIGPLAHHCSIMVA